MGADREGAASGTCSVLPFQGLTPASGVVLVCGLLVVPGPLACELTRVPLTPPIPQFCRGRETGSDVTAPAQGWLRW